MQKINLGEKQVKEKKAEKKNKDNELLALIEIQNILKNMGYVLDYDLSKGNMFAAYNNKIKKTKNEKKEG